MKLRPVLKNISGSTAIVTVDKDVMKKIGIELAGLQPQEMQALNLNGGLKVLRINEGLIKNYTDLKPGFVILSVQDKAVANIDDFQKIIQNIGKGTVILEGIYPGRPFTYQYAFKLN